MRDEQHNAGEYGYAICVGIGNMATTWLSVSVGTYPGPNKYMYDHICHALPVQPEYSLMLEPRSVIVQ